MKYYVEKAVDAGLDITCEIEGIIGNQDIVHTDDGYSYLDNMSNDPLGEFDRNDYDTLLADAKKDNWFGIEEYENENLITDTLKDIECCSECGATLDVKEFDFHPYSTSDDGYIVVGCSNDCDGEEYTIDITSKEIAEIKKQGENPHWFSAKLPGENHLRYYQW